MSEGLVIEAVHKTVFVDRSVEEAFRIFTEDAVSWWPVETHSIHRTVTEIVFEGRVGGEVYEVSATGEKAHWARVLEWDPPHRLVLSWEVNPQSEATEVDLRFVPEGEGTRLDVEHRGWERVVEDAAAKRDDYDTGWDFVLGKYLERI